ncbi:MAG: hypothetical protein EOO75_03190 [Myxococcales bacterium]|nr:MAG: hypothetical protein EOO75_03190 [Myxococcales bacterium]
MTGEPQATIERWAQRLSDRQPPDELTAFVSREVPGAVRSAAERGLPLVVYRLTPWVAATVLLRRSAVFTLDLGWSRGREYAAWVCVAALGPGGLVRVSGRPAALGEVLGLDAPVLRPPMETPWARSCCPRAMAPGRSSSSSPMRAGRA